jgi:hypothetical protein
MPKMPDIYIYLIKIFTNSLAYLHKKETIRQKHIHEEPMTAQPQLNRKSHIPRNSVFFEKIVPVALLVMGMITLGLILFAAGVLLGIVHF